MIVIVIIGLVYTLAIAKLDRVAKGKMEPTFLNLKEYLLTFLQEDAEKARLVCLDDCSECTLYVDDAKVQSFKSFFDSSVATYHYDFLQGMVREKEDVFFNDEGIQESLCFSFEINRYGISDQVIVEYKERAYDYTSYFEPTEVYRSLEELSALKDEINEKVK